MLGEIYRRIKFWLADDRLGPDIRATHWRMYLNSTMRTLYETKFRRFAKEAEFRLGDAGAITLKDDVLLASAVHVYMNNNAFYNRFFPIIDQGHHLPRSVLVERGAWIVAGVIILPGVSIGRNSVIGAGAIVTRDVPPFSVAVGNPSRVIKTLSKESGGRESRVGL